MSKDNWIVIVICVLIAFVYFVLTNIVKRKKINIINILAITICLLISIIATIIGKIQRYVGAPMIGLLIGMIVVNIVNNIDEKFKETTTFIGKKYLSLGIILAGATINLYDIIHASKAIPLVIINICLAFLIAYLIGNKLLKLSENTSILVGAGTSICGGTAIATIASIIKAKQEEIAYAMTSIFLFDVLACISYPYLASLLNLSNTQFAFLAGTSINDTSSVVAAQETYAALNGLTDYNLAVTIKLVRTTMLIVLAIIFTFRSIKKQINQISNTKQNISVLNVIKNTFPWFILIFFIMTLLNTFKVFTINNNLPYFFKNAYKFFITTALVGVGFKVKFKDIFTKGIKPIILGGITWFSVAISSLVFIEVFKNYVNGIK